MPDSLPNQRWWTRRRAMMMATLTLRHVIRAMVPRFYWREPSPEEVPVHQINLTSPPDQEMGVAKMNEHTSWGNREWSMRSTFKCFSHERWGGFKREIKGLGLLLWLSQLSCQILIESQQLLGSWNIFWYFSVTNTLKS